MIVFLFWFQAMDWSRWAFYSYQIISISVSWSWITAVIGWFSKHEPKIESKSAHLYHLTFPLSVSRRLRDLTYVYGVISITQPQKCSKSELYKFASEMPKLPEISLSYQGRDKSPNRHPPPDVICYDSIQFNSIYLLTLPNISLSEVVQEEGLGN